MSQLKVNAIRHTSASSDAITLASDGKATYAATYGTSNFTISDGDLVIGTSGHGISFAATADAAGGTSTTASELLDDYEEGTWTPTSAGGGWTFSQNTSKYTKVGNLVTLQMYVTLSGSGNSAQIVVGGLPYNIVSGGYTTSAFDMGKGSKKGAFARSEPSAQLWFWYPSENTSNYRNTLIGTDIGDGYIIGSISYHTS
tara:strand:+ start:64 stop:660 length:597 start_codon:yes stop_codon:yes gene_type:complete